MLIEMNQTEPTTVAAPTQFMNTDGATQKNPVNIEMKDFCAWYGDFQALHNLNLSLIPQGVNDGRLAKGEGQ